MSSEIRRVQQAGGSLPEIWDIYRKGRYVTTEPSADAAELCRRQLENCNWSYLDQYHSGLAPLEVVAKVRRERGWVRWQLGRFPSGQVLFRGVCSDGNHFSYRLFSSQLAEMICSALGCPSPSADAGRAPSEVAPRPTAPKPVASVANDASAKARAAATSQDGPAKARVPAVKKPAATSAQGPVNAKPRSSRPSTPGPAQPDQLSFF